MAQLNARTAVGVLAGGLAATMLISAITVGIVRQADKSEVPAGFVYAEDGQFMLDGEPFAFAGANAYTLMFEAPPSVDIHMQIAQEMGFKAIRAWAFYDTGTPEGELVVEGNTRGVYFQYWDEVAGAPAYNDTESGLERLDYLLYSAAQHDIKLVLPLVNNWTAFGGIDQYVRWADGEYHDDFFTDPQIKQWYKDWVSHLLNRVNTYTGVAYKDDPTILVWELGNELRCSESGPYPSSPECGSETFVPWADEMSAYVKSIAPNTLVGFGGEGFMCSEPDSQDTLFNCMESGDPNAILALEDIDVHGIHVYPNHWNPTTPTDDWEDWAAWWIEQQGAIAATANKPYYIGEYGWLDLNDRMLVFDNWLGTFEGAGGDGSFMWVMQPASSIGAPPDGLGFTQRCPGPSCNLVANWSAHMGEGVEWSEFAPIAENDQTTTDPGVPITVDVLANDKVFGDATWDLATLDLDPATAGVQDEFDTGRGVLKVVDGKVEFTQEGDENKTARGQYVISDSSGRSTEPVDIAVIISS